LFFAEAPTKVSRRIVVIAAREVNRLADHAAERAVRAEGTRSSRPSFLPLAEAETEALLGGELLAALSGARRRA
jgi:hypothetical protein